MQFFRSCFRERGSPNGEDFYPQTRRFPAAILGGLQGEATQYTDKKTAQAVCNAYENGFSGRNEMKEKGWRPFWAALLAALLVIWGLWYARPIGVETLYPELEPDIIEVYLSDFKTYRHEDRRLEFTAGTEEFDDLWSEIRELRFRRSPFNVVVQALPFLEGIVDTYVKYPETDDLDTMSISFAQDNGTDIWRSEHLKFDVNAWSYRDFDHGVTLPLMMKNGHEIGQKMAHALWERASE